MIPRTELNKFFRFLIVGTIGFGVDLILLKMGLQMGLGPVMARLCSASFAISTTWWLNRHFTFQSILKPTWWEWRSYALVSGCGFALNFSLYLICVYLLAWPPEWGLVVGSGIAMIWNFLANRFWVFSVKAGKP